MRYGVDIRLVSSSLSRAGRPHRRRVVAAVQVAAQVAVAAEAEAVAVAQVRGTRGRALKVVNTVVPLTRGHSPLRQQLFLGVVHDCASGSSDVYRGARRARACGARRGCTCSTLRGLCSNDETCWS